MKSVIQNRRLTFIDKPVLIFQARTYGCSAADYVGMIALYEALNFSYLKLQ